MLASLVRIPTKLHFDGKCCKDLKVTKKMLDLFNKEQMYTSTPGTSTASQADKDNDCEDEGLHFY